MAKVWEDSEKSGVATECLLQYFLAAGLRFLTAEQEGRAFS